MQEERSSSVGGAVVVPDRPRKVGVETFAAHYFFLGDRLAHKGHAAETNLN
jgi:hypothetical protein